MSAQQLDVRRSWGAIRRKRRLVALIMVLGLAGGLVAGFAFPPMVTAKALVALPAPVAEKGKTVNRDIQTQVLIAKSAPVLSSAGENVQPRLTTKAVKKRVKVKALTRDIIEIRADGPTARKAKQLANSVARTYVFYVTDSGTQLPKDLGKIAGVRVLERANTTTGTKLPVHLALFGLLGALAGALLGSLGVLTAARSDHRLQLRDEIADAVGIPVLASMSASRPPTTVSAWRKLLEEYRASAVDAWGLRTLLHRLGVDPRGSDPASVAVISFSGDNKALLLGPKLATFAVSLGIPTTLIVDTRHESTASLIAANQTAPTAGDPDRAGGLRIIVIVVDRDTPRLPDTQPTAATVVAVSPGSVTAEELARLAVEAANESLDADGLVVVNPEDTDHTTGRVPQGVRQYEGRSPIELTGKMRRAGR